MEEQQLQPQVKSTPYAAPMHNFGGSILLLTNPDNVLHKMELTLRCMAESEEGVLNSIGEPLMNEIGISSVMGIVQSIVNQDTVMSNFEDEEVPNLMDFLADTLAKDLMVNRIKYEIKTASARDKIFFTVLSSSFICMKRAYKEGEKRFWKGSQQEITTRHEGPQNNKGVMSKLGSWGRG